MSEELPSGGTDQTSGASQPAAPAAPASLMDGQPSAPAAQQQASEGKDPAPSEAQPPKAEGADGKGTDPEAKAPEGAPEKYEFKPVEGSTLSEDVLGKFSEVAKELNLSQDAAQKMLDKVAPVIAQQQVAALNQLNEEWVNAVQADKEIGGEKLGANLAIAKKARDAFGTDGLRELLTKSRLGNHPEVIRLFVKVGQAISEDRLVPGGNRPVNGGKDAASVLYGKPD